MEGKVNRIHFREDVTDHLRRITYPKKNAYVLLKKDDKGSHGIEASVKTSRLKIDKVEEYLTNTMIASKVRLEDKMI